MRPSEAFGPRVRTGGPRPFSESDEVPGGRLSPYGGPRIARMKSFCIAKGFLYMRTDSIRGERVGPRLGGSPSMCGPGPSTCRGGSGTCAPRPGTRGPGSARCGAGLSAWTGIRCDVDPVGPRVDGPPPHGDRVLRDVEEVGPGEARGPPRAPRVPADVARSRADADGPAAGGARPPEAVGRWRKGFGHQPMSQAGHSTSRAAAAAGCVRRSNPCSRHPSQTTLLGSSSIPRPRPPRGRSPPRRSSTPPCTRTRR